LPAARLCLSDRIASAGLKPCPTIARCLAVLLKTGSRLQG
jgi:hypothetical protein